MKRHTSYTLILAACCAACLIPAEARQFPWTEPQAASEILTDCTDRKRSAGTEAQQLPDSARIYTPIYTLRECMEYAVSNSTQIRIQQAAMDDERIARRDAILDAFTPSIQAGTAVSSNFGRAVDPETNTYISTTSFDNSYSVSAGITLFNGFQAVNNLRITKTAVAMGVSEEQRIRDNICLSTMQAYCNVVYYSRLAEILKEQVETAAESLHVAERQEELGQKGYADVVQMEADLSDREYDLITARNSLEDAYITLKDVMFWPITDSLAIDTSSAEEGNELYLLTDENNPDDIIGNAMNTLPDISIAKGNMENARLELRTARWQLSPTLSLYGGWSTSYYTYPGRKDYQAIPFGTQFRNNGGEYIQLSLSIPIYDRLSRHSNLSKKKNDWRRAQAEYEQTLHDVESEISRAIQDNKGALAAFFQAEKRSVVQEEAYRLGERKMLQGLISPIEFQTVSNDYLNAKAEQLNARFQYLLKSSVVSYYKGISYLDQYK